MVLPFGPWRDVVLDNVHRFRPENLCPPAFRNADAATALTTGPVH